MMVKGFIFFRDGKIPFVIENYRMELFTDDSLLDKIFIQIFAVIAEFERDTLTERIVDNMMELAKDNVLISEFVDGKQVF